MCSLCEQAAASRATVLLDPPGAPSQQLQSARTKAALPLQSLYVHLRAADVSWRPASTIAHPYAGTRCSCDRAAKFGGRFSDADVKMWSREFEEALGVELHVRQKQKPSDFFIAAEDAAALFEYVCVFSYPTSFAFTCACGCYPIQVASIALCVLPDCCCSTQCTYITPAGSSEQVVVSSRGLRVPHC